MKRFLKPLILVGMALVLFTGCEAFFTFNLYDGLDPVILPDYSSEFSENSTKDNLTNLAEDFSSETYIVVVATDETAYTEVNNYLEDVYTTSTDPVEKEEAAVLAADLNLQGFGGQDVINNVVLATEEIQTIRTDSSNFTEENAKDLIQSMIPPEVDTVEEMSALLAGFQEAADAYEELGNSITANGGSSSIELTGGTAINAALVAVVDVMITDFVANDADPGQVFFDLLNAEDPSTVTGLEITGGFSTVPTELGYVTSIAAAVGFDMNTMVPQQ